MNSLALDVGGANLKACHSDGQAASAAFALWKDPGQLPLRLQELAARLPAFDQLLLTMTAELCDCFASKRLGVAAVLAAAKTLADGRPVRVWLTTGRFADPDDAAAHPLQAAASNWHALATAVALAHPLGTALLVDTGSTTTDIIALVNGAVAARGCTDTQRLEQGELVYLGLRRTPLMALGPTLCWRGRGYGVMAEYFATTADVAVLLGDLPEDESDRDTADGRPLTTACAAGRVLRMIGADLEMFSVAAARELAGQFQQQAVERIAAAVQRVSHDQPPGQVVLSGSGAVLAARALALALPNTPVTPLSATAGQAVSVAACAWALLQLAQRDGSAAAAPAGPAARSVDHGLQVIKLGGSLLDLTQLPEQLAAWRRQSAQPRALLLVGGGDAADVVRAADRHFRLSEEQGHWLAVRAMALNARVLASILPACQLVTDAQQCAQAWAAGLLPIVEPVAWLEQEEARGIRVPHRWSFTSDSIAAHLAGQLQAGRLTLLKSTLPAAGATVAQAAAAGVVDADFPAACAAVPWVELVNLRATPRALCVLQQPAVAIKT